jgi:hypothetical protein
LTQLISNERSGLPGIVTAVTHFVCVVVGAPGPWQAGGSMLAPAGHTAAGVSAAAPSRAVAAVPEKYETSFLYLVMNESSLEKRLSTRWLSRGQHCPSRRHIPVDTDRSLQNRNKFFLCDMAATALITLN